MNKIKFTIDRKESQFDITGSPDFRHGEDIVVSNEKTDLCFSQPWYKLGYQAISCFSPKEFEGLKNGVSESIKKIIKDNTEINTDGFQLEKYHKFVKSDEEHFKVVGKTRNLFSEDFDFPINKLISKFSKMLDIGLTDIDPELNKKLHIIIRVNRPKSSDYNPPHKDMYEAYDGHLEFKTQFINLWIPIAGVTNKTSLPIAPSSHLIPESKILRTFDGGVLGGNKYHVRLIKEWANCTHLIRPNVKYGETLVFSSHLIHGLATNEEEDTTRVALEFRLFKK